ncbi:hypothetical protein NQ315_002005 [Exocentrus adspersus]|uniref:lysozyme n=1 Tax=Exocentrus adspersus TaxID=1586481 RepID=A0AAV8WA51_9CUCU|nr:hypothetical protein NQ315_002005 [Exocentrus adspersus]
MFCVTTIVVLYKNYLLFTFVEYSFPFISNYGRRCMRCICEASSGGCDIKLSCEKGYCGPFQISRIEWTDAGNVTFSADDPERNNNLPFISNYDWRCMECICKATIGGCNRSLACEKGYCGPFRISKIHWIDAGNITLPADDPERGDAAYQACSLDYLCAQQILLGYFHRYTIDCNGDGVTNCDDYAMMHVNGRGQCFPPVNRTERGKRWWDKYTECDPLGRRLYKS